MDYKYRESIFLDISFLKAGITLRNNNINFIRKFSIEKNEIVELISYKDLLLEYQNEYGQNNISYHSCLRTLEWENKRRIILNRDKYSCQVCQATTSFDQNFKQRVDSKLDAGKSKNIKLEYSWSKINNIFCTLMNGSIISTEVMKPDFLPKKLYRLEVHHKKYIINKLPWEYSNLDLITVCNYCHADIHLKNKIPVYSEHGESIEMKPCARCNGAGVFPEYSHVQNGICFECRGDRFTQSLFTN